MQDAQDQVGALNTIVDQQMKRSYLQLKAIMRETSAINNNKDISIQQQDASNTYK